MSYIQQFFTSRDNNANAETFVGQEGRLWWDPITNQIYSSDGNTPGGIPLSGGGGNGSPGGANSQVQFNQNGNFGGSANLTFNRVTGALTAVSFAGNGAALTNITGSNVVGEVTNATYASSAVTAVTAETVTANSQPNITSVGILTELSVAGNVTGDYFIGNGSQLTGINGGASNTIFNGNSNVAIAIPDGNVTITANTSQPYTWTFDTAGELSLAGNIVSSSNLVIKTDNDNSWISQAVGANGFSQLYWTSNIAAADPYDGNDDFAWAYVDSSGFHVTSRTVEPAESYTWQFRGSDGAVISPGKFITPPGDPSAIFNFNAPGAGGSSSLEFGADSPGSQYFLASVQDPVGRSAEFWLNAVDEGNINAQIRTNDGLGTTMQWNFNANGDLILPGDTAYIGSDASRVSIYSDITTETAGITVTSGSSTNIFNEGVVNIETNSGDVLRQWQFDQTGDLTIPGSITLPNSGSIITSSYNNPESLMANADSNWAYGFSSDGGANYYTQVKFFGDHSTTRGFKILDSDSGNAWLFNGNGGLTFPDATVQSTAFTGTATSATTAGTVTTNAQPNITSVGTLTSVSSTGDVSGGNLITAGNVVGPSSYNQPRFIQPNASDPNWAYGVYTDGASAFYMQTQFFGLNQTTRGFRVLEAEGNTVVFSVNGAGLVSAPGNVQGGNLLTSGLVSAVGNISGNYFIGNGSQLTGLDAVSVGNANYANTAGSTTQLVNGSSTVALYSDGTMSFPSGLINTSSNTIGLWSTNETSLTWRTPTATTAGQPFQNIVRLSNAGISITALSGNVSSLTTKSWSFGLNGNLVFPDATVQSTAFTGTAATVTTNAQPNITSVGTLTSLTSTGNITGGNLLTGGLISATGNVSGGNLIISGQVIAGNGTIGQPGFRFTGDTDTGFYLSSAGNIIVTTNTGIRAVFNDSGIGTPGTVVADGNVSGGNVTTAGQVVATGNVTGGNLNTGAQVVATGNITGGNLITDGKVTATGTITSAGGTNSTAFAVGNSAVSNVALGYFPTAGTPAEMAIRDYSTVPSTMYFDNTIGNTTGGSFQFRGSSSYTLWAKVDQYGVNLPTRPAFRVYGNTSTNWTTGNITNQVIDYNQGSNYVNSTGTFTAPVAGLYHVFMTARAGATAALSQAAILKNNSNVCTFWEITTSATQTTHFGSASVVKLAAGDVLTLKVLTGGINFDSNDNWGAAYIG